VEAAVAATAAAASHLPWPSVFLLLKRFLRLLKRKADGEHKVVVRTLCAVLDAWHPPPTQPRCHARGGGRGARGTHPRPLGSQPCAGRGCPGPHPQGPALPALAAPPAEDIGPGAEGSGPGHGAEGAEGGMEAWQVQLLEAVFKPMLGLVLVEKSEGSGSELDSRVALAVLRVLLCMPPRWWQCSCRPCCRRW